MWGVEKCGEGVGKVYEVSGGSVLACGERMWGG